MIINLKKFKTSIKALKIFNLIITTENQLLNAKFEAESMEIDKGEVKE